MNITIHQTIMIQNIRIGSIANSSVFQIGSAGSIKSLANLYNTGGFRGPAPYPGELEPPLVPLALPTVLEEKEKYYK